MKKLLSLLLLFTGVINFCYAQPVVNKSQFFTDTSVIKSALTFNVKKVMSNKSVEGRLFTAGFSCKINDIDVNDQISIEIRGHFRRGYCYLPPLKLIYKNNPSNAFRDFKNLKLVSACMPSRTDDQNLLKEYLIYKIYNLLTDKSFRVRLLNLSYVDSAAKKKQYHRTCIPGGGHERPGKKKWL